MGSFRRIKENILGVDILSLIFRATEIKANSADLGKLSDKIAQLQKMHCCYNRSTPIALMKKTGAEIAALQCLTGEKPGIIAECGIDLSLDGIIKTSQAIRFLCVKGFNPNWGLDFNNMLKNNILVSPAITLANIRKIFSADDQEKFKDSHLCMALPWDSFEEAYIPKEIINLINSLSINPFVYRMMLASIIPDNTETLLLTRCADEHCRIAAHWGPEPLSFKIAGLHPK